MSYTNGHNKVKLPIVISKDESPYDDEAERCVLGGLIIDPDVYGYVRPIVSTGDFYLLRHQWVYEEFCIIIEDGDPLDLMTLVDRLNRRRQTPDGGWDAYLIGLINTVPTSMNAPAYARIVQEYAIRRRMILAAQNIATSAYNLAMPIDQGLEQSETLVMGLRGQRADQGVKTAREAGRKFLDRLDALRDSDKEFPGLPTGFTDYDRILGGLEIQPNLLAGRPGMGKSAFALAVALHVVMVQKKRVMFFSLEMSENQIMARTIASLTGIPLNNIRSPRLLSERDFALTQQMTGRVADSGLIIDATPGLTPSQIRAKALRQSMMGGVDLVIIDHLHKMNSDQPGLSGTQLITNISKAVSELHKVLGCPVLYLAQLNRSLESRADKRPTLADLRDSGSLEEDAYSVTFIYRDEYYNPGMSDRTNIADLIVAKNRDGATGEASLFWNGKCTSFGNLQRGNR